MFFWIDPLETMNWGKECTPSVYICCIRIMICLLKTPLHLQALCFNHQHQNNNSSESSQTWGFWHPGYPGNRNIKTNGCFLGKQKCYTFSIVLLLKHRKSLQVPCSKIMFPSHFWVLMSSVGECRKKKKKNNHSEHVLHHVIASRKYFWWNLTKNNLTSWNI